MGVICKTVIRPDLQTIGEDAKSIPSSKVKVVRGREEARSGPERTTHILLGITSLYTCDTHTPQ